MVKQRVYLLTGRPGTGKTSLVRQVVADFKGKAGGFYTGEIREQGTRLGFKLVTLDGQEAVLSHVNIQSPYRVSKYGVDIASLNSIGVPVLRQAAKECDLIVVDEIGKMELFSADFREVVLALIGGEKKVLGTIMLSSNRWADAIKRQPQVKLVEVNRANYNQVLGDLRDWLRKD